MQMMLIHPPLDDPTLPYHSTAYLKGHLAANGFHNVAMRDINVEYVNHLLQPATLSGVQEEVGRLLAQMGGTSSMQFEAQEQYYGLLATSRVDPLEIGRAAGELRQMDSFLDFPRYVKNLHLITGYMAVVSVLSYPSECAGFAQMTRGRYSTSSMADLLDDDLGRRVCLPFDRYFHEKIVSDPEFASAALFGVSIVYDHQLYHAFHFARLLRKQWPSKRVVLGGTAISQLFKYLKDKSRIKEVFKLCDAIVIGEGETAICEIAASQGDFEKQKFTNTLTYRKERDELVVPTVRYEKMAELGTPIYDHPWNLYLSPERGINYSPTRGCYWNRCTFCDYGLNTDRPTSPWRERKIPQVIDDLQRARLEQGVRYVYFAVDVMAPGYLERLSDALLEAKLDMRWSAELRMERIFSESRVRKMAQSGCVCVSFGMESGNQRILDLIDKGTKVEYMTATMKNFAAENIACQLMAFTDFPTETPAEKAATFQFVRDNEEYWSVGGMGAFLLTGTSMIAKNPEKFGITLIETEGADVARAVAYRVDQETGRKLALTEDADNSFNETGGIFPPILGRPWAGGTDSLHSMIYYDRYGRHFFKQHPPQPETHVEEVTEEMLLRCSIVMNAKLSESRFDLAKILENRKSFLVYLNGQLERPAEPNFGGFREWASQLAPVEPVCGEVGYWLVSGKHCVKLEKLTYRVLALAEKTSITIGQIASSIPEAIRARLLDYIQGLERKGLIAFKIGGTVIRSKASEQEDQARRNKMPMDTPAWRIESAPKNDQLVSIA